MLTIDHFLVSYQRKKNKPFLWLLLQSKAPRLGLAKSVCDDFPKISDHFPKMSISGKKEDNRTFYCFEQVCQQLVLITVRSLERSQLGPIRP